MAYRNKVIGDTLAVIHISTVNQEAAHSNQHISDALLVLEVTSITCACILVATRGLYHVLQRDFDEGFDVGIARLSVFYAVARCTGSPLIVFALVHGLLNNQDCSRMLSGLF